MIVTTFGRLGRFALALALVVLAAACGHGRSSPPRAHAVAPANHVAAQTTTVVASTGADGYTPLSRAQTSSASLGERFDRDAAGHSRLYSLRRLNEKALTLIHQFDDPARQALANGVIAWQEQLAAAHPRDGLGAEANAMRKALAATGVTLPPPAADYGDCPVGQQPAGRVGACAPPTPPEKPGCYGPSNLRFYNLAGIPSCNDAIGVYLAFLAGAPPEPWTCEGNGQSGRCYFQGSAGVTDRFGSINWG